MQDTPTPRRNRNLLLKIRPILRWVIRLRSSPKAIAGGLAIGTFLAFTPTVGVQLVLAVIMATFLNLNRPAAMIPVWITNPVTVAPIYTFNYWLGLKFCDGPPLSEVSGLFIGIGKTMARLEFWNIKEQFMAVLHMGKETLIPLIMGSLVVGIITGGLVYISTLKLLSIFFTRRAQKQLLNRRRPRR